MAVSDLIRSHQAQVKCHRVLSMQTAGQRHWPLAARGGAIDFVVGAGKVDDGPGVGAWYVLDSGKH
jgi:hypothetical protein